MEDWQDIAWLIGNSTAIGLTFAFLLTAGIYGLVRLGRLYPKFRSAHTWKSDLYHLRWVAFVLFLVSFLPALGLGYMFSDMCGTSHASEFLSPDGEHKLIVYAFDCGATTDYSLDVSVIRANQRLPKYKTPKLLYSHYHDCPVPTGPERNFAVHWNDPAHVIVQLEGLDNTAKPRVDDGVYVSFERLP